MPQLPPIRAHQGKLAAVDEWMFGQAFASVGLPFHVEEQSCHPPITLQSTEGL